MRNRSQFYEGRSCSTCRLLLYTSPREPAHTGQVWMDTNTRLAMLQILEERYERKSVIIVSQLPINKWYDYIGDPTLADAIMDRLVSNANKIELKGDSMRQKKKK